MTRTIETTTQFRRDLKREKKGRHRTSMVAELAPVIDALADDRPLDPKHRDHALSGTWSDHRDCHVKPDLVLIYRLPNSDELQLVRLGSHSELAI